MFESFTAVRERSTQWFIRHAESRHALVWLGFLSFIDAIFFPIAPEVFLVALMLAHPKRWKQYLPVALVCSVLGAAVGYTIARFLFLQFGGPLLDFYHLKNAFESAQHLIRGHVFLAMAVGNFMPIPDKVLIYAGGFLGVHFLPFITGYFVGRGLRMSFFAFLAERFGKRLLDLVERYFF
jgi:membrane protein YqaA with SNARE-associated domain